MHWRWSKTVQCGFFGRQISTVLALIAMSVVRSVVSQILAEIEAELATVRPAEKTHLRQRAELARSLLALSAPGFVPIELLIRAMADPSRPRPDLFRRPALSSGAVRRLVSVQLAFGSLRPLTLSA